MPFVLRDVFHTSLPDPSFLASLARCLRGKDGEVSVHENVSSECRHEESIQCYHPHWTYEWCVFNFLKFSSKVIRFSGTVCLWSPNVEGPIVQLLTHPSGLKGIAVEETGQYMYTTGLDLKLR